MTIEAVLSIMMWGLIGGWMAHKKGYDNLIWFVLSGITGWMGTILLWLFLPTRIDRE